MRTGVKRMPDTAIHLYYGQDVRSSLAPEVRKVLEDVPYQFALVGPDPWFTYKPWRGKRQGRGRVMHTTTPGLFLTTLAEEARKSDCPEAMFSYLAGFLCHYALDASAHPYIIRQTTTECRKKGAHRALEHSLDALELERRKVWGEKHPLTEHAFQELRLPEKMEASLNRAYERVYGWQNAYRALNMSHRIFRFLYRFMEKPGGLLAWLARLTGSELIQSLAYSESYFQGTDVENREGRPWRHSHDESIVSRESFPELRERARLRAVKLIEACFAYVFEGRLSLEELGKIIGDDSYLSGLPSKDPRNMNVASLLPSEKEREEA